MHDNKVSDDAVQRILDAISVVNVALARLESRIDNLIQDSKDHEVRLRVLEQEQLSVKLLKNDIDDHIKLGVTTLNLKVEGLESDRDSVRGFMKAIAIITPTVSGIVTAGIMMLVQAYGS